MTEKKLRTFKLIDREGFINSNFGNREIIESHMGNGVFEGIVDEDWRGYLDGDTNEDVLILGNEFKFFEEVFEDKGEREDTDIFVGQEVTIEKGNFVLSTHEESFLGKKVTVVSLFVTNNPHEGDVEMSAVSLPDGSCCCFLKEMLEPYKKPWQEQVSEEFDIDYTTSGDFKFEHFMEEERLIEMAKRIIELSEGEK